MNTWNDADEQLLRDLQSRKHEWERQNRAPLTELVNSWVNNGLFRPMVNVSDVVDAMAQYADELTRNLRPFRKYGRLLFIVYPFGDTIAEPPMVMNIDGLLSRVKDPGVAIERWEPGTGGQYGEFYIHCLEAP